MKSNTNYNSEPQYGQYPYLLAQCLMYMGSSEYSKYRCERNNGSDMDMTRDIDRAITTSVIVTETIGTTQKLATTPMTPMTYTETSTESPSVELKLTTELENNSNEKFDVIISTSQDPLRPKNTQNPPAITESTTTDYDLPDNSWTQIEKSENLRTIKKRDVRWKAYGFDSSVLQISDSWAKRNLWFQQVTHSVRTATYGKCCPCVVRVQAPSTWPSILETLPEPLLAQCQLSALSWLQYKQRAARDYYMYISINLFKPAGVCKWMLDLPYLDLNDKHEMLKKAPDSLEVQPTQA